MLKKTAFIVDGSCAMPESEYKKYNVDKIFLRIIDIKNNKEYLDNDDFDPELIRKSYEEENLFKTSCTPIGEVMVLCEELLKKYERVIIMPIHRNISSQWQNCKSLESEYPGKVFVYKGTLMNYEIEYMIKKVHEKFTDENDIKEILEFMDNESDKSATIFTCKTWKGINVGGRLKSVLGTIFDKMGVFPIISIQFLKNDIYSISKNYLNCIVKMVEKFFKINKVKSIDEIEYVALYSTILSKDIESHLYKWLSEKFKNLKVIICRNSFSVCVHTGPDAYGIGIKIK